MIAALSSILKIIFYLIDRFKLLDISPWFTGGLFGLAILTALSFAVWEVATKKEAEKPALKDIPIPESDKSTGIISGRDTNISNSPFTNNINSTFKIGETPTS